MEALSIAPTTEAQFLAPAQDQGVRKLNAAPGGDEIGNGSNEILEQQGAGEDQEELYEDDDAVSHIENSMKLKRSFSNNFILQSGEAPASFS